MELFQNGNEALAHLTNYANSQRYLQTISNPAGLLSSDVLGNTKFLYGSDCVRWCMEPSPA
jgi:hypothetical protein